MKKLTSLLLVLLVAQLPLVLLAHADSQFATYLITIDRGNFDPKSLQLVWGEVVYIADSFPVAVVRVPVGATGHIAHLKGVKHVSQDGVMSLMGKPSSQPPQSIPWGVQRIGAPNVWGTTSGWVDVNGDGNSEIEVAIFDTGIDTDHPDLVGNIKWGVSVLNGRISTKYNDLNGHGTHVSGTIAALNNNIGVVGVAPKVEIYMLRVLGASGSGSWSDLVIAIDLAIKGPDGVIDKDGDGKIVGDPDDDAPEVFSMSLGGSSAPEELHTAIQTAYNWGITIVAAAGNDGASSPSYPAAYPEVIAVGAIDSSNNVPSWSNRKPEVAAPGVDILSTYPDNTYATLSGTSMATPHVSATVALIQAARLAKGLPPLPPGTFNDSSTSTVRGLLHVTAEDLGSAGYDDLYGYGVVRVDKALEKV
jgi:subtilisin family serine protease